MKNTGRPLKRAIQKYLEDPFAEEIINSDVSEGDLLRADLPKGSDELTIEVIKGGLLTMPEGAEEALDSQPSPASGPKKPAKKTSKKKRRRNQVTLKNLSKTAKNDHPGKNQTLVVQQICCCDALALIWATFVHDLGLPFCDA